eukprot:759572-Hanusia_phi.AAC.2
MLKSRLAKLAFEEQRAVKVAEISKQRAQEIARLRAQIEERRRSKEKEKAERIKQLQQEIENKAIEKKERQMSIRNIRDSLVMSRQEAASRVRQERKVRTAPVAVRGVEGGAGEREGARETEPGGPAEQEEAEANGGGALEREGAVREEEDHGAEAQHGGAGVPGQADPGGAGEKQNEPSHPRDAGAGEVSRSSSRPALPLLHFFLPLPPPCLPWLLAFLNLLFVFPPFLLLSAMSLDHVATSSEGAGDAGEGADQSQRLAHVTEEGRGKGGGV